MDVYEHAQHIYTALLAAQKSTGQPLPNQQEQPRWATLAMDLAKLFQKQNANDSGASV